MEDTLVLEDLCSVGGRSEMVSKDPGETRVSGFPLAFVHLVASIFWNSKPKTAAVDTNLEKLFVTLERESNPHLIRLDVPSSPHPLRSETFQ